MEYGTVRRSVNFPQVDLPFTSPQRLTFFSYARESLWADVNEIVNQYEVPVKEMMGNTREGYAYTIVNTDLTSLSAQKTQAMIAEINSIDEMLRVRVLNNPTWQNWH
ncbi:hypothetical protein [Lentilactobacillus kisonensis]|uniref:hypothetical protein n=1 Tax=Lentilactobacillus kisonensis TaxID=481722 RepID=UPI000AADB767|nr:hypothetical protein [Lentilactobacillus kisonensis]